MAKEYCFKEDELREYCQKVLKDIDLSQEDAQILTDTIVAAELRGISSHGVSRLPYYVERINQGLIKSRPSLEVTEQGDDGNVFLMDADHALGQVAAYRAMSQAIQKARDKGVCWAGIKNTNHIGIASFYSEMAAKEGMVGIIAANTNPAMAPFGGVKALFGTNPCSIAAPTREKPIVLDMATTNVARGKIRMCERSGQEMPVGWAKDSRGRDTTDPAAALEGTLTPMGGPKGYGIALMIDIMAGILTGSGSTDEVGSLDDYSRTIDSGNVLMVLNIESMIEYSQYLDRVEELKKKIKESPRADGVDEILLSGELEYNREENHRKNGVNVDPAIGEEISRVLGYQ